MATFTAYQATDMRLDLWRGVVVDKNRDTIIATDGYHVARFDGSFSYPGSGYVGGYPSDFAGYYDIFGLGPVSGTLTSYSQDRGTQAQFDLDMMWVPARPIFQALSFDNGPLASALVFAGPDSLVGSRGADFLLGYAGDDILSGLAGNDLLKGGPGLDTLFGGDGDDRLRGGANPDSLRGDAGRDTLIGEAGPDQLTGGAGADTFRFLRVADSPAGSGSRDTIRDFAHRTDTIDLRPVDADATAQGKQSFVFIGSQAFTDTPGQLRYASHVLAGDTDGDGRADFQINLSSNPTLTAGDLLL